MTANLLTGPFAKILADQRGRFNAKFAEAKHFKTALNGEAFKQHLRVGIAPIVNAVHEVAPERAAEVAEVLYDLSLELVGQDLLGPEARYPVIVQGWVELLPALAPFIAAAPRPTVGAMTNALYKLALAPGARPQQWLELMRPLVAQCPDWTTWLQLGQIAAWRAGLAHYRREVLALAIELAQSHPALVAGALGLDTASIHVPLILQQFRADPWWQSTNSNADRQLQRVARVGAFRGFGGLFITPPVVALIEGRFVLSDAEGAWLLTADVFGATFQRYAGDLPKAAKLTAPFKLDDKGRVTLGEHEQHFPELAQATSAAATNTTLIVTTALSHAAQVVALVSP